jgi:hypothetical protein
MVVRLRPRMREHPEDSAVPLKNENRTAAMGVTDAQDWSDRPLKRMALRTKTRLGLSARRSGFVLEGCVKHQGPGTRPRPQAGAVHVRDETRKDRNMTYLLHARCMGSGESDLLNGRWPRWGNPMACGAVTALNSRVKKKSCKKQRRQRSEPRF